MKTRIIIYCVLFALLFASTLSAMPPRNQWGNIQHPIDWPDYSKSSKLSHQLFKLVHVYRTCGPQAAREYARLFHGMDYSGDRIPLTARTLSPLQPTSPVSTTSRGGYDDLLQGIHQLGGSVTGIDGQGFHLQIPMENLTLLARHPSVLRLDLPLRPRAHDQITSEGVNHSGAARFFGLQGLPASRNAKVAIIDTGFSGYEALLGEELPDTVTTRSFRSDGDITAGGKHGTACAEVVHDMAPDAALTLINFNDSTELSDAVSYCVQQGIHVISHSMGWYNAGAGNGTGPINDIAEYALQNGIAWVNSAGNDADTHWEGRFTDNNGNNYMDFGGDDMYTFRLPAYATAWMYLNWKDWGAYSGGSYTGSSNDYDLYLYVYSNGSWQLVDSSANRQAGGGDWPVEAISGWYAASDARWGIRIRKAPGAADKKLELFLNFNGAYDLENPVPAGSLTIPGDSRNVIAVAAIPWQDGYEDYYFTYSSRGPTSDGRIKPDIAAASSVSNSSYGTFGGTSAAAPHVAGAVALLHSRTPFSLEQIRQILFSRSDDWGKEGKDNIFGHGKLDLDD